MKQSRAMRIIARVKRLLRSRRRGAINTDKTIFTSAIRFRRQKLVGAIVKYGDHLIRIKSKVDANTYTYESIKSKNHPRYK